MRLETEIGIPAKQIPLTRLARSWGFWKGEEWEDRLAGAVGSKGGSEKAGEQSGFLGTGVREEWLGWRELEREGGETQGWESVAVRGSLGGRNRASGPTAQRLLVSQLPPTALHP